jgi:phosphatidylglycerol---prolipoprotein diacylglyceryl transferase
MIPYIIVEPVRVGPFILEPFGILVALGVLLGISLATRRAKRVGLDDRHIRSFITWILVGGFVGAHVLDSLFYHPREVLEHPWSLLILWAGLSSFGGFIGASLGALAWKYYTTREGLSLGSLLHIRFPIRRSRPARLMPYADVIMAVFPVSWMLGRAGCSVVHDHPGTRASADSWFSVAYGPGPSTDFHLFQLRHGVEARYDLGFLEMLFAMILAVAFALTWRQGSAKGWYVAAAAVAYAPVRFALDFLRLGDPEGGDLRYALLTPAQWACIGLLAFGVWLGVRLARSAGSTAPLHASEAEAAVPD